MKTTVSKFVTVFGICVITVSLSSGCATQPNPAKINMATQDLNHFRIDCSRKQEQIEFLQRQRLTHEDQFAARLRMMVKTHEIITAPEVYRINHDMANGNPNKYINFLLRELSTC
jgi:hypothetical protein